MPLKNLDSSNTGLIVGRFSFRKTVNGNLIGEFSNNGSVRVFAESAILLNHTGEDNSRQNFVGIYNTSWIDESGINNSRLLISLKADTDSALYSIKWEDDNDVLFVGEGFLIENNTLIGDYRNFNLP